MYKHIQIAGYEGVRGPGYDLELFDMLMRRLKYKYELVVMPHSNDFGYKVRDCKKIFMVIFNSCLMAVGLVS